MQVLENQHKEPKTWLHAVSFSCCDTTESSTSAYHGRRIRNKDPLLLHGEEVGSGAGAATAAATAAEHHFNLCLFTTTTPPSPRKVGLRLWLLAPTICLIAGVRVQESWPGPSVLVPVQVPPPTCVRLGGVVQVEPRLTARA